MIKRGDQVVCVDPGRHRALRMARTYTVAGSYRLFGHHFLDVGVSDGPSPGFYATRFRPKPKRKTNIAPFEKLLDAPAAPARKRETA